MTLHDMLEKRFIDYAVAGDIEADNAYMLADEAIEVVDKWFAQELDGVIDPDDRAVALHKARVAMLREEEG